MKLDLHVHTTVSDGFFSPEGVLELAERAGLKVLAITDHDAIEGYDRAAARLDERPGSALRLLAGIEFSTSFRLPGAPAGEAEEVHVLGYFPAGAPEGLRGFLAEAERSRLDRIEEAIHVLARLGYPLSFDAVRRRSPGRAIGRPHLAREMVAQGFTLTAGEAFRRFLGTGRGIVPPSRNRAEEVVALIRAHGGVASLAHPPLDRVDEIVRALRPAGLEAIEIFGRRQRRGVDQLYLETLARELGLLGTGGTDWHGHGKVPDFDGLSLGLDRIGPFLSRVGLRS